MAGLRRKRRVLKWAGLLASTLIIVASVVSLRWGLHYTKATRPGGGNVASFGRACVSYRWNQRISPERGWWTIRFREWPQWLPVIRPGLIVLPLWIPFLLVAVPTACLWYRDRRIPPGHCRNCGYNLTGNVSGVCPECGEKADARSVLKG